jgi:hypothetical protein
LAINIAQIDHAPELHHQEWSGTLPRPLLLEQDWSPQEHPDQQRDERKSRHQQREGQKDTEKIEVPLCAPCPSAIAHGSGRQASDDAL